MLQHVFNSFLGTSPWSCCHGVFPPNLDYGLCCSQPKQWCHKEYTLLNLAEPKYEVWAASQQAWLTWTWIWTFQHVFNSFLGTSPWSCCHGISQLRLWLSGCNVGSQNRKACMMCTSLTLWSNMGSTAAQTTKQDCVIDRIQLKSFCTLGPV